MHNRIYNYFVQSKLLFPVQSGFQTNTSPEHAILELVCNITKSFEKNGYVLGVFMDLKVLEYLRTCNIFCLINGPRVTLGIFD